MHIHSETIFSICKDAGFSKPKRFNTLSQNEMHKIFLCEGLEGSFVMTFYFLSHSQDEIATIKAVSNHLFLQGLPVSKLWYFEKKATYSVSIHSYICGKAKTTWDYNGLQVAAEILGAIHMYSSNQEGRKVVDSIEDKWLSLCSTLPEAFSFLEEQVRDISYLWPKHLPSGLIHSDLVLPSLVYQENELSGLLHLQPITFDVYAFDLACLLGHCLFGQEAHPPYELFDLFLSHYETFRKVEEEELESLFLLLRAKLVQVIFATLSKAKQFPGQKDFYYATAAKLSAKIYALPKREEFLLSGT